jgi:hypothetical protein
LRFHRKKSAGAVVSGQKGQYLTAQAKISCTQLLNPGRALLLRQFEDCLQNVFNLLPLKLLHDALFLAVGDRATRAQYSSHGEQ